MIGTMTTMIPVPAEYTTHTPPLGNWRWLTQIPLRYLNGQRVHPPTGEFYVWRWSKPVTQIAERIALREWERVHGWEDAENKVGYIQYMVQLMALDQCGLFNAMSPVALTHPDPMDSVTKTEWNWGAWACFCRFFAGMPETNQLALLTKMFAQDCSWADWFFGLPCESWVYFDPWYDTNYVYQLPRKGPFNFAGAPFGAPPIAQYLPPGAFPPNSQPPAPVPVQPLDQPPVMECPEGMTATLDGRCEPPVGPVCPNGVVDPTTGECIEPLIEPPAQCPPGEVWDGMARGCVAPPVPLPPPAVVQCDPGFVYDPASGLCVAGGATAIGAKSDSDKVSGVAGWKIAAASLLGVAGVAVLVGALTSKPNPVAGHSGYTLQQVWNRYLKALRSGDAESARLWYDEFLAKGGWKHAADTAMATDGRSATPEAIRAA
jgi:hypothetical protein